MLKELTIKNFRGLNHLQIKGLSRVNIFIGKNGSGKTSVLEAVSVLANPTTPEWLGQLGRWRELPPPNLQAPDAIAIAFPNLDVGKTIAFDFLEDLHNRKLEINAITDSATLSTRNVQAINESSASAVEVNELGRFYGIEYKYHPTADKTINNRLEFFSEGTAVKKGSAVEKLGVFYIHARRATSSGETASVLTSLFERKLQEPFMKAIRAVDHRVLAMQPGVRGNIPVVLVDVGLNVLLPMNALGDGFCRVCLMLTGIVSQRSKIVVVDEIDSGLHHKTMSEFWLSVLRMTEQFEFQLFCSTHSEEMLYSTLPAFANAPDALRVFRLDRNVDGGISVVDYDYAKFKESEDFGLDIR